MPQGRLPLLRHVPARLRMCTEQALRLCLVNIALTGAGIKLPPVTFLSVVAPLIFVCIFPAWLYLEVTAALRTQPITTA